MHLLINPVPKNMIKTEIGTIEVCQHIDQHNYYYGSPDVGFAYCPKCGTKL